MKTYRAGALALAFLALRLTGLAWAQAWWIQDTNASAWLRSAKMPRNL